MSSGARLTADVALIGAPNAGKSSLMNRMIGSTVRGRWPTCVSCAFCRNQALLLGCLPAGGSCVPEGEYNEKGVHRSVE